MGIRTLVSLCVLGGGVYEKVAHVEQIKIIIITIVVEVIINVVITRCWEGATG